MPDKALSNQFLACLDMVLKTRRRRDFGTIGRGVRIETSQSNLMSGSLVVVQGHMKEHLQPHSVHPGCGGCML